MTLVSLENILMKSMRRLAFTLFNRLTNLVDYFLFGDIVPMPTLYLALSRCFQSKKTMQSIERNQLFTR